MADDVGAEAFGSYGGSSYGTPNIDQMASEGMRFENAHSQPLCTPSRVKIMTGHHNFRNYRRFAYMEPSLITFGNLMQDAGYATGIVGKWQLYRHFKDIPTIKGMTPEKAGFNEYFIWYLNPDKIYSRYWKPVFNNNGKRTFYAEKDFGPSLVNERVLDFIERKKDVPFFLYYPMLLPHAPFVTTPDESGGNSSQEKFGSMMRYMDKMVGNVRQKVLDLGLEDRTLIIFTGDNGTHRDIVSVQDGKEIIGAKGKTITHGTHVPFVAWGGPTLKSTVSDNLIDFSDILPTVLDLAGTSEPDGYNADGESIVPILKGNDKGRDEHVFIHYDPRWGNYNRARYAFDQRWKLYSTGELFDMVDDPLEHKPLEDNALSEKANSAKVKLQLVIDSKGQDHAF